MAFQLKFPGPVCGPLGTPSKIALEAELRKARWKLLLEYSGPLSFKISLGPLKVQGDEAMKHWLLAAITMPSKDSKLFSIQLEAAGVRVMVLPDNSG